MIFLISAAMADAAPTAGSPGNGFISFLPMLFFIGVIYFLLIRPQQKRAKQHQALIASIKKGDKVVTNSGIIGTIAKVLNEQEVLVEIADKVFVKFLKSTISTVVNPTEAVTAQPKEQIKAIQKKDDNETKGEGATKSVEKKTNLSGKRYRPRKNPANKTTGESQK